MGRVRLILHNQYSRDWLETFASMKPFCISAFVALAMSAFWPDQRMTLLPKKENRNLAWFAPSAAVARSYSTREECSWGWGGTRESLRDRPCLPGPQEMPIARELRTQFLEYGMWPAFHRRILAHCRRCRRERLMPVDGGRQTHPTSRFEWNARSGKAVRNRTC